MKSLEGIRIVEIPESKLEKESTRIRKSSNTVKVKEDQLKNMQTLKEKLIDIYDDVEINKNFLDDCILTNDKSTELERMLDEDDDLYNFDDCIKK